jgi:hypothetical protein
MLQGFGVHRVDGKASLQEGCDEQAMRRLDDTGDLLGIRGAVAPQKGDQRLQTHRRMRHSQRAVLASRFVHDRDVVMRIRPVNAGKPHPLPPVLRYRELSSVPTSDARRIERNSEESQAVVALYAGARGATFYER